jgi:hypothetical protein
LVNEWVTGGETSSESSESEEDKNKKITGITTMDDEEPPFPTPPMCFMASSHCTYRHEPTQESFQEGYGTWSEGCYI